MINLIPPKLRSSIRESMFASTRYSLFVNPYYIIRNGLFRQISRLSSHVCGKVLDVGCGSKPYESLFANAETYVGVDILTSSHDSINCKADVFYDGKALPFSPNSFDTVVCFEVFEHVFNIDELLAEIGRVLKPSGLMLLSVPFAYEEHGCPSDFARYTSFGLPYILELHGFETIELAKTTTYILALFQLFFSYLFQNIFIQSKWLYYPSLMLVLPLNAFAIMCDHILPANYQYYCNFVILARRMP